MGAMETRERRPAQLEAQGPGKALGEVMLEP